MATVNEERKEKQLIISGEQLEKAISDIAELKKSLENTGDLSGVPELQEQVNTIEANLKKINDLAVTDSVEISSVKIRLGNLEENTYTKEETDSTITAKVSEIVADAPEDFDTLKEMSDWLTEHSDSAATMNSDIANLKTGISEHTASIEALEENLPKVYEDVTAETNEKLVPLEANIGANAEAIEALETDISSIKENVEFTPRYIGIYMAGWFIPNMGSLSIRLVQLQKNVFVVDVSGGGSPYTTEKTDTVIDVNLPITRINPNNTLQPYCSPVMLRTTDDEGCCIGMVGFYDGKLQFSVPIGKTISSVSMGNIIVYGELIEDEIT